MTAVGESFWKWRSDDSHYK